VLEGSGEGVRLRPSNLQLAPPAPVETAYNVGKAQYELPSYSNNGRPRRCRAGSGGGPSYSTRRPPEHAGRAVTPPEAGALLPRPNAPTAFREARRAGLLPVRLGASPDMPLRWVDPQTGADVGVDAVDAARWLPALLDGLRETEHVENAYVALQASLELARAAAKRGALLPVLPAAAPPIRKALEVRESAVVCAALRALQFLLRVDERAGAALRPQYKQLLPPMASLALLRAQPVQGDEIEYSQHRRVNISDLVAETLQLMERRGGAGASAVIKSHVPSFHRADEVLHRGFR